MSVTSHSQRNLFFSSLADFAQLASWLHLSSAWLLSLQISQWVTWAPLESKEYVFFLSPCPSFSLTKPAYCIHINFTNPTIETYFFQLHTNDLELGATEAVQQHFARHVVASKPVSQRKLNFEHSRPRWLREYVRSDLERRRKIFV